MKKHRKMKWKKAMLLLLAGLCLAAAAASCWVSNVLIDMALCRPKESIWDNDAYASVEADVEASYVVDDQTQENMLKAYEKKEVWLAEVETEPVSLVSEMDISCRPASIPAVRNSTAGHCFFTVMVIPGRKRRWST